MSPIELNAQSPAPKGSVTGKKFEDYFAAVTDWSDGANTFNVVYSNAVADPDEIDDALADGRLDIASANPIYEPQDYPASAALNDLSFLGDQGPVDGILQAHGSSLETANASDPVYDEFTENGVKLLLPYYNGGSVGLFCSKKLTDLDAMDGAQAATSTETQSEQAKSLGATPVSIAYTEVFESLNRGVVDCTTSSLQVAALSGFTPGAPHVIIDPEVGFGLSPGTIAFSQATWETLPLPAQQLLYDRLDVFLESSIKGTWENAAAAVTEMEEKGGEVSALPDDARDALAERNDELIEEVRGRDDLADADAFVKTAEEGAKQWANQVRKTLPFDTDVDYADFVAWQEKQDEIDLSPYIEVIFEKVLNERRPS